MSDPTNDIDALLRDVAHFPVTHARVAALVAERDALRKRVEELERDVDAWREDAHKWKKMYDCHYESERIWISRVVELERQVESHPPADRDRELRERLVAHVENLRAELAAALKQRDEARRLYCVEMSRQSTNPTRFTPEWGAKQLGWDCFKEGGGA